MENSNAYTHGEASPQAPPLSDKIGDNHGFTMAGAQGMQDAIAKGNQNSPQKCDGGTLLIYGTHGLGERG